MEKSLRLGSKMVAYWRAVLVSWKHCSFSQRQKPLGLWNMNRLFFAFRKPLAHPFWMSGKQWRSQCFISVYFSSQETFSASAFSQWAAGGHPICIGCWFLLKGSFQWKPDRKYSQSLVVWVWRQQVQETGWCPWKTHIHHACFLL